MGIFGAIPLLFTPNVTNSGIVNGFGLLVHGNSTTFSGGPSDDPELLKSFGQDLKQFTDNTVLTTGTIRSTAYISDTSVTPAQTYFSSNIQIASIDSLLNFNYGILLDLKIRSGIVNLLADLNVISIDNIIGYIVPTQREIKDLSTYVRRAVREENTFDAVVEVKIPYKLFQVFTKNEYVYAAVQKGIEVFDLNTSASLYIREVPNTRITTIWGNATTLFFGGIGGLFYIDYVNLHADYENATISGSFPLKSQIVRYIHGKDTSILVTTSSGVEYFNWSSNPVIKSNTYIENAGKCFLTSDSAYYFTNTTLSGEAYWTLNKKQNLITDWTQPTKTFNTGDTFTLSTALTDLYITERTTTSGNNTIFCATTSGIYVIDEDEDKKAIYYTRQ